MKRLTITLIIILLAFSASAQKKEKIYGQESRRDRPAEQRGASGKEHQGEGRAQEYRRHADGAGERQEQPPFRGAGTELLLGPLAEEPNAPHRQSCGQDQVEKDSGLEKSGGPARESEEIDRFDELEREHEDAAVEDTVEEQKEDLALRGAGQGAEKILPRGGLEGEDPQREREPKGDSQQLRRQHEFPLFIKICDFVII